MIAPFSKFHDDLSLTMFVFLPDLVFLSLKLRVSIWNHVVVIIDFCIVFICYIFVAIYIYEMKT